jgi:hypothetical protein
MADATGAGREQLPVGLELLVQAILCCPGGVPGLPPFGGLPPYERRDLTGAVA